MDIDKPKDRTEKYPVETVHEPQIYHYGGTELDFTCNLSSGRSLFLSSRLCNLTSSFVFLEFFLSYFLFYGTTSSSWNGLLHTVHGTSVSPQKRQVTRTFHACELQTQVFGF